MVGERVKKVIPDREPVWRRLEDRVDDTAHRIRNRPGERLRGGFVDYENRNVGAGTAVGTIEAAIAIVLKETLGVPFGSDTEIVDTEPAEGGMKYIINVDAPFENMSRAKAFFEANTGFTSLLTDHVEVENVEVLNTRPVRDTYQIEVLVED